MCRTRPLGCHRLGARDNRAMRAWYPDELAFAGREHLDAAYVASYDRKAGYDPSEDIGILVRAGLSRHSTVLDLGAGTGAFAIAAAKLCRQVIAVDVSAPMVEALHRRTLESDLTNVTLIRAGFLSYEHTGDPVDFIFTRNALHQLPDFWKAIALTRMAEVLRPGGTLRLRDLIFDFDPQDADQSIESWIAGAALDPSVGYTAAELAEHVRIEFSTFSWLFDALLAKAGFEVQQRDFVRGAYGAYTCRRPD
jgi:ubiquinone/menaquinone biosynthesis C-methylase UbiE